MVFKIADELGYKAKRRLKNKNIIGVIVPELISPYYATLVHTLEERIREKGFGTLITITGFSMEKTIQAFRLMEDDGVNGIVCSQYIKPGDDVGDCYAAAERTKVPVVFLNDGEQDGDSRFNQINLNQKSGMEQIINHLLSLGHTQIGYIGECLSITRLQWLELLMESRGLKLQSKFVKVGEARFEKGGYEQMKLLLAEEDIPTAVIAAYDQFAIGALKAIDEAGLQVPDDISIVGFDNIATNEYLHKKLTSVTNPIESMGQIAIKLLFNKITDENSVVQNVSLFPTLIVRETTKCITNQEKE